MKKARFVTLAFIPFLLTATAWAGSTDGQDIVGRWKRTKENGEWVMYDYRSNGSLFRANNLQGEPIPFGTYRLADGAIYFQDTPENYTPVKFAIKTDTCSGHTGPTLFLYDKDTGSAYGCYFRIEAESINAN